MILVADSNQKGIVFLFHRSSSGKYPDVVVTRRSRLSFFIFSDGQRMCFQKRKCSNTRSLNRIPFFDVGTYIANNASWLDLK